MIHYPNPSRASVIDCPVHECTVALDADGRIASTCPACILEARKARRRLRTIHARERAAA